MIEILVATSRGCQVFSSDGTTKTELPGKSVWATAPDAGGACLATADQNQIWRRSAEGQWMQAAVAEVALASIMSANGKIFVSAEADASLFTVNAANEVERMVAFDSVPGRDKWVGNGPPLYVRSLASMADGQTIMAAVHVGGIPRSTDGGKTWVPTIPITFDVHELKVHPTSPLVAAAAAVGLCVSFDAGGTWKRINQGMDETNSLAVAVLDDEVLFSIQDGPFAKCSQLWRWKIAGGNPEQVRQGLPEWLKGKVDTGHIAANKGRAAVVDGGGDLWVSKAGSADWECIATNLQDAFSVQIL